MIITILRRGTKALAACCSLAVLVAGCGESIICQSEVLVAIVEPAELITDDLSAAADGVQTDVRVRTTFGRGVELTLTIEDDAGMVLATTTALTDTQGNAIFEEVTIPPGGADLRVVGDAGECGRDEDLKHVEVVAGADCVLGFATAPEPSAFYAPLDVFNGDADGNAAVPGFQGDIIVTTSPGHEVKLFLSGPGAVETQVGTGIANDTGELRLAMSLPEGQDNLRVACAGPGGVGSRSSGVTSVFVDTVAPVCTISSPVPGTSLTPSLDDDMTIANGIQLELTGHAAGGDTASEGARFVITAPGGGITTLTGTAISAGGDSTADASFNPTTPPADFDVAFSTIDHAGNPCTRTETFRVVYDGCPIVVTAPITTVTTDADGNAGNGAQVDVVLDVADACIGRTVTSDCGSNDIGGTVGALGVTTLRADVCGGVPCESAELCTVRVTSADGIETTAGVNLRFDNQPPSVAVQVSQPAGIACGGTVTPAQDIDGGLAGTQIRMSVVSPQAADRRLRLTNSGGTNNFDANGAGGEVVVTVLNGSNDFVGTATDAAGNTAMTAACRISLADISVNFTGSPADGGVGGSDGTVAAGNLTFTLTGTVSVLGATVTIAVDGGAAVPAVVTGTSWSLVMTLAGRVAPYAILASATAGPQVGSGALSLVVDLSPPPVVTGLTAVADTRHSIRLQFTAPSDGGAAAASYRIRFATVALTDGNFDTTGLAFASPVPGAPGSAETVRVRPLRTGTAFWIGVAAVDAAGNRSVAQIAGPLTPRFDQTAAYAAPNTTGNAQLGYAIARGRFNDDAFDDVAIAAPFTTAGGVNGAGEVYVYFGSAAGLASAPAVTIRGTVVGGQLGFSLAAVRWSSGTRDDLAIGAPFAATVYVFNGGAAFPAGTVAATTAPRRINVAAGASWFSGSGFGWSLAAADHDGDGTDDLVATAVFGGGGVAGAAVVFYGGTVPSGIVAISDVSAAGSGTAVMRMYEQPLGFFGGYLHNLGPTQGSSDVTDDLGVSSYEDFVAGAEVFVFRSTSGRPAAPGVTREPFTVGRDVRIQYVTPDALLEWGVTMGSISDQNGDGARDIVIGDFRAGDGLADAGVVFVIDGDTIGVAGVAATNVPGVALVTLQETTAQRQFGMSVVNNATSANPDVDGDGNEDLVVGGRASGTTQSQLQVWFGPLTPGVESPPAPDHTIDGPVGWNSTTPTNGGSAIVAIWAGDVNGDGLDDICWADQTTAGLDGSFQVLWDDGN